MNPTINAGGNGQKNGREQKKTRVNSWRWWAEAL